MFKENFATNGVYLLDADTLRYPMEDPETGKQIIKKLKRGQGVDSETFDFLAESYHEEALGDRYYHERSDAVFEKKKTRYEIGDEDGFEDPIQAISDDRSDIFSILFKEEEGSEILTVLSEKVIPQLSESQADLFYALFGECITQKEYLDNLIATTGKIVSHQAISSRVKNLLNKVRKLLEEQSPE